MPHSHQKRKKQSANIGNQSIEVVVKPFPFLKDKLKGLQDKYHEAIWENDLPVAYELQKQIAVISQAIKLGEKYDIPF